MSLIDKIIGGVNHLSDTVDKVLNFTRPVMLTRNRVSLNHIVREALHLLDPQLTANKIETELDLAESPLFAMLDEASIRAVLINLIVNSIQAMPAGGHLSINTRGDHNGIHFTIADTGVGMTDEQVKHIFEPFYTTKSQGLGLGMSYAWKIIQQHEGTILIDSQVGKGTQMKITLPVEE
jgi:signal transduction histidine kinase